MSEGASSTDILSLYQILRYVVKGSQDHYCIYIQVDHTYKAMELIKSISILFSNYTQINTVSNGVNLCHFEIFAYVKAYTFRSQVDQQCL